MTKITVVFSKEKGGIKAMHGVGQPPMVGIDTSDFSYLRDAHISYSRLHDVGGWFGGNMFVDIPNVFRNFDADVNDPASYDFTFTDLLLNALVENGIEPYYRLGVTIENFHEKKAYRIFPPKDFRKWAEICEHIIRHYNEGWADGFHLGITYWEIWCEPDGHHDVKQNALWKGTPEQYFELYKTTSLHLRKCFGDSIKIGGYGSCGFYAALREQTISGEAFGELFCMGTQTEAKSDNEDIYVLSAAGGGRKGILISNIGKADTVSVSGAKVKKAYLIDENHHFTGTEIDENAIELAQYGVIYMECE